MEELSDNEIQAPKAKKTQPIPIPQTQAEVIKEQIIVKPIPKTNSAWGREQEQERVRPKKKELTEKQKETLAKGRANLAKKKQEQKESTKKYKEEMIIVKAQRLQDNIKRSVGLDSDDEEENEIMIKKPIPITRKKPKKVVYVEPSESEDDEEEEECIYEKVPKPPKTNSAWGREQEQERERPKLQRQPATHSYSNMPSITFY